MADDGVENLRRARNIAYLRAYWAVNRERLNKERRDSYANDAADRAKRLETSNNYYKENKDKVLKKRLANYVASPEFIRNEVQKYRDKYAEKIAATKRERYAADPSKWRAATKKWARANPEKVNASAHRHRAKKLGADGNYEPEDIVLIRKSQKDRCGFCRQKLNGKGHIDHIVALTKGGSNWPRNLQLLCVSCNISKSNRDQIDFAQSRGLLL